MIWHTRCSTAANRSLGMVSTFVISYEMRIIEPVALCRWSQTVKENYACWRPFASSTANPFLSWKWRFPRKVPCQLFQSTRFWTEYIGDSWQFKLHTKIFEIIWSISKHFSEVLLDQKSLRSHRQVDRGLLLGLDLRVGTKNINYNRLEYNFEELFDGCLPTSTLEGNRYTNSMSCREMSSLIWSSDLALWWP